MFHVLHVVGTRPNFVKMAPVIEALAGRPGVSQTVVHTGQHYDKRMSSEMLDDLEFPRPDIFLSVGSGTHGEQTGRALIKVEEVLLERRPTSSASAVMSTRRSPALWPRPSSRSRWRMSRPACAPSIGRCPRK